MQWPMATFKKSVKLSSAILTLISSVTTSALDESTLWLPSSYTKYYLKLKEAAFTAESLERCQTVLRATIDLEQSTEERPIYRILCRQENNKTYNEMVDGITMDTLTTKVIVKEKLSPEELEKIRLEEEKRLAEELKLKKLNAWNLCSEALNEKIALMADVEWLGEYPPEPDQFSDENSLFTVDFDATDMYKQPLHYQAKCQIEGQEVSVSIKKRLSTPTDTE